MKKEKPILLDQMTLLDFYAIFAMVGDLASGTDAGRKYPTTQAGAALAWQDTGTADIRLTVTASAATNAGLVRFTILYAQNNNLA